MISKISIGLLAMVGSLTMSETPTFAQQQQKPNISSSWVTTSVGCSRAFTIKA